MGVDAPNLTNVIQVTPPSNLESYVQEIRRSGKQSFATIHFINTLAPRMKKYYEEMSCFTLLFDEILPVQI